MKLLWLVAAWLTLLAWTWIARRLRASLYVGGRSGKYDSVADLLDHLWLLFYEPIHTTSRIWYRIRAIIRTLRTLSNE